MGRECGNGWVRGHVSGLPGGGKNELPLCILHSFLSEGVSGVAGVPDGKDFADRSQFPGIGSPDWIAVGEGRRAREVKKTNSRLCILVHFVHSFWGGALVRHPGVAVSGVADATGMPAVLRIEPNFRGLEVRAGSPWESGSGGGKNELPFVHSCAFCAQFRAGLRGRKTESRSDWSTALVRVR